jgi:hypothetical protein
MSIHSAVRYKGYILDCEPLRRSDSSYVAQVVISWEAGQDLTERIFPELSVENSTQAAVSFAKAWGRHWIDEHGRGAALTG